MKVLQPLTNLAVVCALSACGTYVNPCGTGSPNNPTCPLQSGSSSSSSSSSSGGSSSGSSSGSAAAAPAGFSIAGATVFDAFRRADTQPGSLGSSDQGMRYQLNAHDGTISHGVYTYSGSEPVSAAQALRGTVRRIGAAGRWRTIDPAGSADGSIVLGLGSATDGGAQLQISRTGWQYRDRLADGTLLPLAQGSFAAPLDAGTEYWFDLSLAADNRSVTLTLPGAIQTVQDARVGALLGNGVTWQEQPGQARPADVFDFLAVWATEDGQPQLPAAVYAGYNP
jgi:hypothetical protein